MRRSEQAVDDLLQRVRRAVSREIVHFLNRWRQADQIKVNTAKNSRPIGPGCRCNMLGFELRQDESINRAAWPGDVLDGGWGCGPDRLPSPVIALALSESKRWLHRGG